MDNDELYHYYAGQYRATIQGGSDEVTDRVLREQTARVEYLLPELPFEEVYSLLDIGASTGLLMEALKEKYNCETLGIEPGEKFRNYARNKKIKMLSDIDILNAQHENSFDLITMIHVLEHLSEPAKMLTRLHDYITEDGRLLIEVPNLFHEYSLGLSHPVAFTQETLRELLARTGWEIEWEKLYHSFKIGHPNPANILICAKPGRVVESKVCVDIDGIHQKYAKSQQELNEYELQRQAAAQTE
jgi:2-polyprenyl-3-methyl-5-hydroxy-6-metoxy-1,4-benzoquinol methylase